MDDWKIGDLALCTTNIDLGGFYMPEVDPGGVYTVSEVGSASYDDGVEAVGLLFSDALEPLCDDGMPGCFDARLFRKIHPLSDAERDSFLADLSVPRQPVEA